ncbi:Chitinase domain-containing protein 1 [Gonapodya sp. JEL0774]|nr:Chitinase domain-containing protein 1 [Gonapodya sp. JEL0774]
MTEVRRPWDGGKRAKIVPRLVFEGARKEDWEQFIQDDAQMDLVAETVWGEVEKHNFDGIALEAPLPLSYLYLFLLRLSDRLHNGGRVLLCTVKVYNRDHPQIDMLDGLFDAGHVKALEGVVDRLTLVTYDYSTSLGRKGPNSPTKWIEETVNRLCPEVASDTCRKMLLAGVNLYGNKFGTGGGEAIVANQYLNILREHNPKLIWDDTNEEHYSALANGEEVWYPTPLFLETRVALAEDLGTGVHLWEVGQGLDVFYHPLSMVHAADVRTEMDTAMEECGDGDSYGGKAGAKGEGMPLEVHSNQDANWRTHLLALTGAKTLSQLVEMLPSYKPGIAAPVSGERSIDQSLVGVDARAESHDMRPLHVVIAAVLVADIEGRSREADQVKGIKRATWAQWPLPTIPASDHSKNASTVAPFYSSASHLDSTQWASSSSPSNAQSLAQPPPNPSCLPPHLHLCPPYPEDIAYDPAPGPHGSRSRREVVAWRESCATGLAELVPTDLLDLRFGSGNTALHLASLSPTPDLARRLLSLGANPMVRNGANLSPAETAILPETRAILAAAAASASTTNGSPTMTTVPPIPAPSPLRSSASPGPGSPGSGATTPTKRAVPDEGNEDRTIGGGRRGVTKAARVDVQSADWGVEPAAVVATRKSSRSNGRLSSGGRGRANGSVSVGIVNGAGEDAMEV